jgi:hypothetical protein
MHSFLCSVLPALGKTLQRKLCNGQNTTKKTMHWANHYKENYTLGKTLQRKLYIGQNTTKKTIHWAKHYKENYSLGKTLVVFCPMYSFLCSVLPIA